MKALPEIHKERFEAWLMAQPDDRTFEYSDSSGCLCCMFFKENTSLHNPSVGPTNYNADDDFSAVATLPAFVIDTLAQRESDSHLYTFGSIKTIWRKLFPEVTPDVSYLKQATGSFIAQEKANESKL